MAAFYFWRVREVDADADDDLVCGAFEQDSGELGWADQQIVGPFDRRANTAATGIDDGVMQRDGGDERKAGRGRIAGFEGDTGRAVEIAGRAGPVPT